jgi:filamentous hemagglutinin family protein
MGMGRKQGCDHLSWVVVLGLAGALNASVNAQAQQIVPDATLPLNSAVTVNGNNFTINGGTQAGGNLFHSFSEFSVPTNGSAFFNNAQTIQNIISRVTGSSVSNIDGILRANGTANLFLLNPNGIVFGPNASLNVGGSFVATTANAIQFGNVGFFSASNPNNPALLTVNPSALFFNQIAAASNPNISTTARNLSVPNGQGLFLVGGNINIDSGRLNAFGGRVELGGLAEVGTVGLNLSGNDLSLSFPDAVTRANVSLTNGALVDVRAGNGGTIAINARSLQLLEGSRLFAGIRTGLGSAESQAGNIEVNAQDAVTLDQSFISNNVSSNATGQGGSVNITTGTLNVNNGAQISTSTFGQGNAGVVSVQALGDISLRDRGTVIFNNVERGARGDGGTININSTSGSLFVTNGAQLQTLVREASDTAAGGIGNAGDININVRDRVSFDNNSRALSSVGRGAVGNGGDITVTAGSVSLSNGAGLIANTSGQGNAGVISVQADGNISLQDRGTTISSNVGSEGVGNGGSININSTAGSVSLSNGAELVANSTGQGNAGNIYIKADELSLTSNAAFVGDLSGQGRGADINLDVTGKISLIGGETAPTGESTRITLGVQPSGRGDGGNLNIKAGSLELRDGAIVKDSTQGNGNAGNVDITADVVDISGSVPSSGLPSGLFTSTDTIGKAGDITVNSRIFQIADGAALSARTRGDGQGGNITVNSTSFEAINGGQLVTTTFGQGQAGNIFVNAKERVNISGSDPNYLTRIRRFPTLIDPLVANDITETGAASGLFASAESGSTGQGGSVNIKTGTLSLSNGAQISSSTFGQGNAGVVSVQADGDISLKDRGTVIFNNVEDGAVGNGGTININSTSGSLFVTNGAQLQTLVRAASSRLAGGIGNAGDINIRVRDTVSFNGSLAFSSLGQGAMGDGGDINVTAGSVSLSNGARLIADISGQGNGGNININSTPGSVSLSNGAELVADVRGQGNAGSINIKANQLSLTSNAAFVGDLSGQGRGADINLDVTGKISLIGGNTVQTTAPTGESTRITLGVQPGGRGDGGNLNIKAGSLELRDGAIVKDSTQGNGNAGNIDITADVVDISGSVPTSGLPSGLFTSTDTTGKAGDITVNSRIFQIADGAALSARTRGDGQGGNITVNTTSLSATNGAQLLTTTSTQAQAGNIFVNAKEQVNISGSDPNYSTRIGRFPTSISRLVANDITETGAASGLFASTVSGSTGQGGNLTINTPSLRVQDQGIVTVSSPQGQAGNLNITANTIRLNQGSLTAETAITRTQQGANINLQGLDLLLLQNGSRISAQANGIANGGNITIDAPKGFVVAPLGQDNDIIASASLGRGGNITINTQGLFNFFEGRSIPGNTTNDIDASSEFSNPGTVTINTPNVDPSQGLVTLPIGVVNVPNPSASGCTAFIGKEGSSFTVTGRGGLPPSPDDFLSGDVVWSDTRNLAQATSTVRRK